MGVAPEAVVRSFCGRKGTAHLYIPGVPFPSLAAGNRACALASHTRNLLAEGILHGDNLQARNRTLDDRAHTYPPVGPDASYEAAAGREGPDRSMDRRMAVYGEHRTGVADNTVAGPSDGEVRGGHTRQGVLECVDPCSMGPGDGIRCGKAPVECA